MNSITKVFFRSKTFVPISLISLRHFGGFKRLVFNIPKIWRISSKTGYLIAGCCFSRQSDEDALLQDSREKFSSELNIPNIETKHLKFRQSIEQQNVRKFENMKRKTEFIDETVSNYVDDGDNSHHTHVPEHKKAKTDETSLSDELLKKSPALNVNISPLEIADTSKDKDKLKKNRPNYFVAVQISNDQIHQALKKVQDHILVQEVQLKNSMTSLKTLHITLMVMYIGDDETHARALKVLQNVHSEYDDDLSKNPLQLEFKGLSHFQNRVLYVEVSTDDGYQRLCSLAQSVKQHFADASIFTTDSRENFTPHLTVAKIAFKGKQKGIKKINSSLYKEFIHQHFGTQKIESIQLLSMLSPKNTTGYYSGDEIYFSAFKSSGRIDSLRKLLSVDEQKKDVKDMINKLMKEKLK